MKNMLFAFFLAFVSMINAFARDLPINKEEFELWNDVFQISFDNEPCPDFNGTEIIEYQDTEDNFGRIIFYKNTLYSFVFTEFSNIFRLDENRENWTYDYEIEDEILEIFNNAIGAHLGVSYYNRINNYIGILHEYREFPSLVGLIKSTENLTTQFNIPLSIDGSQDIFGRPDYYIVQKNRRSGSGIVITVYEMARSRIIFIFMDRFLMGLCFLN
jgi:hypothetical protein